MNVKSFCQDICSKIPRNSVYLYAGFLLGYIIGFLDPGISSPCQSYFFPQLFIFFHPAIAKYFLAKVFYCSSSIFSLYLQKTFILISLILPLAAVFLLSVISKRLSVILAFLIFLAYGFYAPYIIEYGKTATSVIYLCMMFFLLAIYSLAIIFGKEMRQSLKVSSNKKESRILKGKNQKRLVCLFAITFLALIPFSFTSITTKAIPTNLSGKAKNNSIFIFDNATIMIFAPNKTFFLIKEKHELLIKGNSTFFIYFNNGTKVKIESGKSQIFRINRMLRPNYGLWYETLYYSPPFFVRSSENDLMPQYPISIVRKNAYTIYAPANFQIVVDGKLLKPKKFASYSGKRIAVYEIKNEYINFQIIEQQIPFKGLAYFLILFMIFIVLILMKNETPRA